MSLDGAQMEALVDALRNHFEFDELRRLVRYKLDKDIDDIVSPAATKVAAVFAIVNFADKRGLINKLVEGARGLNPALPQLQEIFELVGIGVVLAKDRQILERDVTPRSVFQNPAAFRERLSVIETWVCRVEIPGGGGTGLLVHDDLVLTNQHVMEPIYTGAVSRDAVTFRFDYKAQPDGTEFIGATRCGLATNWNLDRSPPSIQDQIVGGLEPQPNELDYALVRIAAPLGLMPISSQDAQARKRGSYPVVPQVAAVVAGDPLLVLQYPSDLRLQLAIGAVLGYSPGGTRLRHNARTLGGSSGSPCFDANLRLVALHHAGDPDYSPGHAATYNQAIPLSRIVGLMQERGVQPFWLESPP